MLKRSHTRRFGFGLLVICLTSPALAFDPTSPFGVTAFIPSPTRWQAMQDAMIVWNRCDFSWKMVETSQNVFNWSQTDQMVNEANARGLKIYAGLGYSPPWATSDGNEHRPASNPADWADYCTQVVNRYKASIQHWEVWNEPNLSQFFIGTRQQYIDQVLKVAADAIHAADPNAKVLAPEISSCCSASTWMTDVLNQAGNKIDIIAHHQYDGGDVPSGRLAGIDSMHNTVVNAGYGNKETWVTESGFRSDSSGMNEQLQGQYLVAMLVGMETRPWWRNFMWYQIWEGGAGTEKWGLLYQNETKKPAWFYYRDYIFASNWGPQTPFGGTPRSVPGLIQAEDFDDGGAGVGYGDTDGGNNGGAYRSTDVDIENSSEGGFNVGWTAAGEFLKYTINVTATGSYNIELRVASCCAAGTYHIQVGGINKTSTLSLPVTGGWQTWQTVTVSNIPLNAGTQVLKFYIDGGGFNLNWINVVSTGSSQTPYGGTPRTIPGTIQAEDFDNGGEGVAYHDLSAGNAGGAYRSTDVDIEGTSDTGGGYNVGWIDGGEWLEYTVNVNNTGDHTFKLRVASCCSGGTFTIKLNNNTIAGVKSFASTGGWQTWTTIFVPAVYMAAGSNQILQVYVDSGGWNLNKIDVGYGGADAVHVDLASSVLEDGMTHPQVGDGDTAGATIGGHNCRVNVNNSNDYYFYFAVFDSYAYQGNRPNLWVSFDYYDSGSGTIMLQYDATSNPYKNGQTVSIVNSNTWKSVSWNITDAYFGNRQNNGADFRLFRGTNITFYIDICQVSLASP